jgi:hypothetical protein
LLVENYEAAKISAATKFIEEGFGSLVRGLQTADSGWQLPVGKFLTCFQMLQKQTI